MKVVAEKLHEKNMWKIKDTETIAYGLDSVLRTLFNTTGDRKYIIDIENGNVSIYDKTFKTLEIKKLYEWWTKEEEISNDKLKS